MHEELSKLRPKRLPIPEQFVHEQFKKYFGYKRAIKFKVIVSPVRLYTGYYGIVLILPLHL
jgi:hypothetical protein